MFTIPEPEPASAPPLLFTPAAPAEPAEPLAVLDTGEQVALRRAARSEPSRGPNKTLIFSLLGGGLAVVLAIGITMALWPRPAGSAKGKQAEAPVPTKSTPSKATSPSIPRTLKPTPLSREEDLEVAKRHSAKEKKDLLIWFDGSDWSPAAKRLAQDVFESKEFGDQTGRSFLVVWLDFPEHEGGKTKARDPAQNDELRRDYAVGEIPTVIFADAQGRPYAYIEGYKGDGVTAFVKLVEDRRKARTQRDELFDAVAAGKGEPKLEAAKKALAFLRGLGPAKDSYPILAFYDAPLAEWFKLAASLDPDNAKGNLEEFFTFHWLARIYKMAPDNPAEREKALGEMAEFTRTHKFRNTERAALLYLGAAWLSMQAQQWETARRWAADGLALQPNDPQIKQRLAWLKSYLGLGGEAGLAVGTGSGFVVAANGNERFLLTNSHVVAGGGQLFILLPNGKDRIPAEVVNQDMKADIALLRLTAPEGLPLAPLAVAWERELQPGQKKPVTLAEEIAVFGYPLVGVLGAGVKFTQGAISAEPDAENDHMLLLNCLVNPGNSGGPLCDRYGNVVGMVRAKIGARFGGDSLGLAIPAQALESFLAKNIPNYQAAKAHTEKKEWNEIAAQVKASVLMVVRVE